MSELKLLNCPFCGGEARLYGNSKLIGTKLKHYQVTVCTNDDCGCRTSPCETVEDAIYKWNRRKPMANIVENIVTSLESEKLFSWVQEQNRQTRFLLMKPST